MDLFLTILTYIGLVTFTVSGAMLAIRSEVDLFGVVFLSVTTAFGGGMIRDIILNRFPYPAFLEMKYEFIVCVSISLLIFVLAHFFRDTYLKREKLVSTINNVFDSIGVSAFAITGTQSAMRIMQMNRAEVMPVVAVVMGMISCIGGGLMRDVMLGKLPWVLKKRIYAVAALLGSTVYVVLLRLNVPGWISIAAGCSTIIALRFCATFFHWDMPVAIRFSDLEKSENVLSHSNDREYYTENDVVHK